VLTGTARSDYLKGGADADYIKGGGGNDTIAGDGSLTANAKGSADILQGGAGNDVIFGNGGADTIDGGSGQDEIHGGRGADFLAGGLGADRFVFGVDTLDGAIDRIRDFSSGQKDRVDLSILDARSGTANINEAFTFIGKAEFHGVEGEVRYEVLGRNANVTADMDGDGAADLKIVLVDVSKLVAGDFIL
jgi:Ca2+-binding RTX toxin-like protein